MVYLKRTREDILISVVELVHQQGFQATGLKELFAVSGASSGSFYNYFPSKDELAHALIDFKWGKMQETVINRAAAATSDPIAQVFWLIDQLEAQHLLEPNCAGCLLGNLIVDLVEHDPTFRAHLITVFDQWQAAIAACLWAGRAQLRLAVNPDGLAEHLLSAIQGVLLLGRLYDDPARLKRGFDLVRSVLQSALT